MVSGDSDFDFLLVGSGVAAATVAMRLLARDPRTSILMLEAGDRIPSRDRGLWWDYVTNNKLPYDYTYDHDNPDNDTSGSGQSSIGNVRFEMHKSRITAMGGTTMHWGGWSLRMKPEDFVLCTNTGKGGDWTFSYDELEPYYCQAEDILSVSGGDEEGGAPRSQPYGQPAYPWQSADEDLKNAFDKSQLVSGRMPLARYRRCMTTGTCRYCPVGARFSAQYLVEDLENGAYPNFVVRTGITVTGLDMDGKRRVSGVSYLDRHQGNVPGKATAKTVIVCAGAFESPKLLLRSRTDGHENGIGNNNDLVGRFLVSHSFLSIKASKPTNKDRVASEFGFPTLMSRSYDTEEWQPKGKIFLFRNQNTPKVKWEHMMHAGKTRAEMDAIATGKMEVGLSAFYEEFGCKNNRLTLNTNGRTDQFNLPLQTISFSRDKQVKDNAGCLLNEMAGIMNNLDGYTIVDDSAKLEGAAGYHASGTCRMADSPENGVTDGNQRVYGTDNLYICSNAVFPSIGAVNPTLTLTAVALRLADHLGACTTAPQGDEA